MTPRVAPSPNAADPGVARGAARYPEGDPDGVRPPAPMTVPPSGHGVPPADTTAAAGHEGHLRTALRAEP